MGGARLLHLVQIGSRICRCQFRQDKALALLLGDELPAAQTARDFLAQFHAEDLPLLQNPPGFTLGQWGPTALVLRFATRSVLFLGSSAPLF